MEKIIEFVLDKHVWLPIVIIISVVIILKISGWFIGRRIEKIDKSKCKNYKKKKTYMKLVNSIINYLAIIVSILFILQIFGVNVTSIIAGLGVASIIAGLALQDALKDIIMGFNIIVDSYFSVGDVIKIGDFEGKIIELGLKATKLKDINNENVLVIANRNIVEALNLSEQLDIDIPIPYDENTIKIENIIEGIVEEIKENKSIKDIKYLGINEFGDSAIFYKLRIWCNPELKPSIKRFSLKIIKQKLDENNITIPYKQIDIHNK